ncbi:sigma-70 family RNA polymerase sigma factor [Patescibacteria group bacterium]|nr:sigma-70 family RNA polymerase sigma factor [Patescibacteria group bacterium]
MENAESTIITRCQAGELEQFAQLYDVYIKKIYSFIFYKTSHKETAEDLTSQTFFKALQNINKYDSTKGSFSSWLYRIARNNVIDYYRSKKNAIDIDAIWDLSTDSDIERDIDVKQKLQEVSKHLNKLKPLQKEIVVMRLWDQLSYQEISEITKNSVANSKMIFSRSIRKLREEMSLIILFFVINITNII